MLQDYEKLLTDPVANAYLIQKKFSEVEKKIAALSASDLDARLSEWQSSEQAKIEKAKDDFRFQFGQQLRESFEKEGIKLRGQYPLLRVGMFTLKLNFDLGEATLFFGPEVEKLRSRIALHPQSVHDAVKEYDAQMRSGTEMETAYEDVLGAYGRCLAVAGRARGEKVPIVDVLKEYVFLKQSRGFALDARRENFRGYPRIALCYMLYALRMKKAAEQGMRLHVATFDATVDKSRSFWVPDNEDGDGTHYEYISFEPQNG